MLANSRQKSLISTKHESYKKNKNCLFLFFLTLLQVNQKNSKQGPKGSFFPPLLMPLNMVKFQSTFYCTLVPKSNAIFNDKPCLDLHK